MSKNFIKVQNYYRDGLWTINQVRKAIGIWITEEEFLLITKVN